MSWQEVIFSLNYWNIHQWWLHISIFSHVWHTRHTHVARWKSVREGPNTSYKQSIWSKVRQTEFRIRKHCCRCADLPVKCPWMLPHLSLFMLGDEVTVEVLQGHFGHGDPLLGVVTHGWAWALARHRHALPNRGHSDAKVRVCESKTLWFHRVAEKLYPVNVIMGSQGKQNSNSILRALSWALKS